MSYQCMHVQEQYPLNSKTFKKFSPSRPFSTPPQTREQVATEFCPYFTLPTKTDSEAKNLQFNLTPFLFFLYTALFDKGHFSFLCQSVLSLSYLLLILQLFSAMIQTLKKKKTQSKRTGVACPLAWKRVGKLPTRHYHPDIYVVMIRAYVSKLKTKWKHRGCVVLADYI